MFCKHVKHSYIFEFVLSRLQESEKCCWPQVMGVEGSGEIKSKASLWQRDWASGYEEMFAALLETAVMPCGHLLICGGPSSHSGVLRPQLVLHPSTSSCHGCWSLRSRFLLSHGFSCLISLLGPREPPFLHLLVPTCGHATLKRETTRPRGSLLAGLASRVRKLCILTAPCAPKRPALGLVFSSGKTLSSVTPP